MKLARALALLVAVGLAALAVWRFSQPKTVAAGGGPAGKASGADGSGAGEELPAFDPEPGRKSGVPRAPGGGGDPPPAAPASVVPLMPTELPDVGTPVKPGESVDVSVRWKRGEKNRFRYEIIDLQAVRDRESGTVTPWKTTWRTLLEVVEGDGSGAARVRVTVESIRVEGFGPTGLPFDVDSRVAESGMLDDPVLGRMVNPLLSCIGRPLEFRTDAAGVVTDVDGADEWRERFLTEVQRMSKGAVNDAPDAPTREMTTDRWTEYLFPRLGGGKVAADEKRPWARREPYLAPWAVDWKGTLRATRDDPGAFRVMIETTPTAVDTGARATSEFATAIQAVRTVPLGHGYRAEYRIDRTSGSVIEGVIHARYEIWVARRGGGAPGQAAPRPTFTQMERRVSIRRTSEE